MNTELLAQLRDIHAPEAPSHWPPGPLAWAVLALALAVLALGLVLLHRWRDNAWRRQALLELQQLAESGEVDGRLIYARCNLLLKRVCSRRYGVASAALIDDDWLRLLASLHGDDDFARDFQALCEAPYSTRLPENAPEPDYLLAQCRRLIERAPKHLQPHLQPGEGA